MNIRFLIPVLSILVISGLSCIKGDENCAPKTIASETAQMQAYASAQGMTASTHSSGIVYQVLNSGAGVTASPTSKIFIRYTGKTLNGNVFDSQTDHTRTGWTLGGLIQGFQIGIPLIQEGGSIKMIIPSSLAYGCQSLMNIPSNSILYFEIELVDVQ